MELFALQAEKTIASLREETNASIQERDKLKGEIVS